MELAVALAVLAVCLAWVRAPRVWLAMLALFGLGALLRARAPSPPPAQGAPRTRESEYISSRACLPCHPSEHASWRRTFHRTMTQLATPAAVLAPLEGPLFARGGEVWTRDRRVALVTGSHREQVYWLEGEELELYPEVWLVRERRFIPRADAFLDPPEHPARAVHWRSNCIQCHTTAPSPLVPPSGSRAGRSAPSPLVPEIAELGIACEACHGPGGEHARKHADPIERHLARGDGRPDPSIVQPAKLSPERAAEVCAQCHAYAYPRDEQEWWANGYTRSYRPGQKLEDRFLLTRALLAARAGPTLDAEIGSIYWADGTMRVGGREHNAMILSPCYERGIGARKLTCTSCHSMHAADPDDQLKGDLCGGCHAMSPSHSRHVSVRCEECHMPKTSYALFSAIRSHRVESPRASGERLSACNLCHTNKTLAWTGAKLAEWYGQPRALEDDASDVPAAVRWALRGDAAERALAADALGDPAAIAASGSRWQGPILDRLARDPYAAVRFIAQRSRARVSAEEPIVSEAVLDAEIARRDDRPVTIAE